VDAVDVLVNVVWLWGTCATPAAVVRWRHSRKPLAAATAECSARSSCVCGCCGVVVGAAETNQRQELMRVVTISTSFSLATPSAEAGRQRITAKVATAAATAATTMQSW
jgi:hypothetical protein